MAEKSAMWNSAPSKQRPLQTYFVFIVSFCHFQTLSLFQMDTFYIMCEKNQVILGYGRFEDC